MIQHWRGDLKGTLVFMQHFMFVNWWIGEIGELVNLWFRFFDVTNMLNKGKAISEHEIMIAIGQCEESLTFVNGVCKKLRRAFGMRGLNPVYAGAVAILVIGLILTTINIHRLRYVNHPFYKISLILSTYYFI